MPRMTLKALRQQAPVQDRNDPALTRPVVDRGRHTAVRLLPRTISDLREMSRDFADAAIAEVAWRAIGTWLMKDHPAPDRLRYPVATASAAVHTIREQDRHSLRWPRYDGNASVPIALDGLTPAQIGEAKAVASDTLNDWEASGCPYLTERTIGDAYRYLAGTPAFIRKYTHPDDRAMNKEYQ